MSTISKPITGIPVAKPATIPGTPAIPAVPAVPAVACPQIVENSFTFQLGGGGTQSVRNISFRYLSADGATMGRVIKIPDIADLSKLPPSQLPLAVAAMEAIRALTIQIVKDIGL